MEQSARREFEQMKEHYEVIKKAFRWENQIAQHFCALLFSDRPQVPIDALKEAKDFIKEETGLFSPYRNTIGFLLSSLLLAKKEEIHDDLSKILALDTPLKEGGFKSGLHRPMAAYVLYDYPADQTHLIEKAKALYDEMRKLHPFLTAGDDYPFSILLAKTDVRVSYVEDVYEALNQAGFRKSNGLQMLAHLVGLGQEDKMALVEEVIQIEDRLQKEHIKLYSEYYPAIGLIAIINRKTPVVDLFIEMTRELHHEKGYRWLGRGMSAVLAAALLSRIYGEEELHELLMVAEVIIAMTAMIAVTATTTATV